MYKAHTALALLIALSACGDGQPLYDETNFSRNVTTTDNGTDGAIVDNENDTAGDGASITVGELPPGTDDPTEDAGIIRFESRDGSGSGLVEEVAYDAVNDVFVVDNLAFDGANRYARGTAVSSIGSYAVYQADQTTPDFLTSNPVQQINLYRALFGTSRNLDEEGNVRTSFAIVRTGGYNGYGFGGYIYERNGGTTLADVTTGQATFSGPYGGVRVYENAGGIDFVRGAMTLDIDFEDFNANNGVKGNVTDRQRLDSNGNVVENLVDINWVVIEGVNTVTDDGEIVSDVFTVELTPDGASIVNLEGTFTGIIAGDMLDLADGGEVVGVIKMEGEDLRREGVNIQETGGAILYRIP